MRKISNFKATGSAITAILKELSQLSGKAVMAVIRQLLLGGEADKVNWMMSGCWREYSAFISWVWMKMVRSLLRMSCYFGYNSWLLGFYH